MEDNLWGNQRSQLHGRNLPFSGRTTHYASVLG